MKALVKKYAEKGIWMDDVPEPTVGINDVKIKMAICIIRWDFDKFHLIFLTQ